MDPVYLTIERWDLPGLWNFVVQYIGGAFAAKEFLESAFHLDHVYYNPVLRKQLRLPGSDVNKFCF